MLKKKIEFKGFRKRFTKYSSCSFVIADHDDGSVPVICSFCSRRKVCCESDVHDSYVVELNLISKSLIFWFQGTVRSYPKSKNVYKKHFI